MLGRELGWSSSRRPERHGAPQADEADERDGAAAEGAALGAVSQLEFVQNGPEFLLLSPSSGQTGIGLFQLELGQK